MAVSGKHMQVLLSKGTNGFGFNIVGGMDRPYLPHDGGIFVSRIRSNGAAAADGRIRRGDRIVAVNGVELQSINHEEAVELFRSLKGDILLDIVQGALSVFPPPMATVRSRTTSNVSSASSRGGTPSDRCQYSSPAAVNYAGNGEISSNDSSERSSINPGASAGVEGSVATSIRRSPMKQLSFTSQQSETFPNAKQNTPSTTSPATVGAPSAINTQVHTPERAASYRPREGSLQSTPSRGSNTPTPSNHRFSGSSEVGDTVDTPSVMSSSSPAPSLASLVDDCASIKSMPSSTIGGARVHNRAAAVGAYATPNVEGRFGFGVYSEAVYTAVGLAAVLGIAVMAYRRWAS